MKHIVFVESNTTGTGGIAVQKLLARKQRVTFLTRTPKKYPFLSDTSAGLCVKQLDTNSFPVLLSALREIQVGEGIDGVLTLSEFYVPLVAQLAKALGLPGLDPVAAQVCRHKPSTRKALSAAGMLTPEFYLLTCEAEAKEIAGRISYPCVVKPPSDSSSHGVRLVRHATEFLAHYRAIHRWDENVRGQSLDGSVLVETLLDGPEYSVETFTASLGDTRVIGVTDKHLSAAPHFVEVGHDFPSRAEADTVASLAGTAVQALTTVGFNFGPAHTEIRLTQRGPAVVEINPRLAGGMIPELIKFATGIDVLEAWIDLLLGGSVNLNASRDDHACIRFVMAAETGRLGTVRGLSEIAKMSSVREVVVTARPGTAVRPAEDAYDRIGFVIAANHEPTRLDHDIEHALGAIGIEVEPPVTELCETCSA